MAHPASAPNAPQKHQSPQMLVYYPALGEEIGDKEAYILGQLIFWIRTRGEYHDGRRWFCMPYVEMRENGLRKYSVSTLQRVTTHLETLGFIDSTQAYHHNGYDRRKWYAINNEGMAKLTSVGYLPDKMLIVKANPIVIPADNDPFPSVECSISQPDTFIYKESKEEIKEEKETVPAPPPQIFLEESTSPPSKKIESSKPQRRKSFNHEKALLQNQDFMAFAQELANLTCLDFEIKQLSTKILMQAEILWKRGHRIPDLQAVGKYWVTKDWRGKEGGIPHLSTVVEIIKPAVIWAKYGFPSDFGLFQTNYLDSSVLIPDYIER
jgi:hypothetical protein